MSKKIAVITDMSFMGSGYFYLFTNLATGLAKLGHQITVAGLGYMGESHSYPFSIIPSPTLQDAISIVNNLNYLDKADLIMVALDIPLQRAIHNELKGLNKKYIAITPMENGPLMPSWALALSNMDWVYFISELGKQEAIKAGVTKVDHLYVGVDTKLWHPATPEERAQLRSGLGIEPDEFVIMTAADNQERKNLWAGMEIVRILKSKLPDRKIKYIMVTRDDNPMGWNLRDLAVTEGITKEYVQFQRGIPSHDLWGLYVAADVYLQPSKAEGLGLPVLEAMACGIPCVATDTGALHEVLWGDEDGQPIAGYLIEPEYSFIDVWGNSRRDMINVEKAAETIKRLANKDITEEKETTAVALQYVRNRNWDTAIQQVDSKIKELFNETQTKE